MVGRIRRGLYDCAGVVKLEDALSTVARLDLGVDRIRSDIEAVGPTNSAERNENAVEGLGINQGREDTRLRGGNKPRHVYDPFEASRKRTRSR
jgi:hypothetical protein